MRLAAVRRLAFEAADTGFLSPELAAGIGRVKGAKRLGVRIGNWLTVEQSRTLLAEPAGDSLRGKRDRAILALLIGCGLRRAAILEEWSILLSNYPEMPVVETEPRAALSVPEADFWPA